MRADCFRPASVQACDLARRREGAGTSKLAQTSGRAPTIVVVPIGDAFAPSWSVASMQPTHRIRPSCSASSCWMDEMGRRHEQCQNPVEGSGSGPGVASVVDQRPQR
jgi:hypothetical protein